MAGRAALGEEACWAACATAPVGAPCITPRMREMCVCVCSGRMHARVRACAGAVRAPSRMLLARLPMPLSVSPPHDMHTPSTDPARSVGQVLPPFPTPHLTPSLLTNPSSHHRPPHLPPRHLPMPVSAPLSPPLLPCRASLSRMHRERTFPRPSSPLSCSLSSVCVAHSAHAWPTSQ